MESQNSATLFLKYFINTPLAYKLMCQKLNLTMEPLVLPQNHIKVSLLIFPSMGLTLMKATIILSMKE